jgi:hypothetical protein
VEEVGCRVVGHRREAGPPRHDGADAVARGEPLPTEDEHLVVLEAVRRVQLGASAVLLLHDEALVGHQTATDGIEHRLAQLHEEQPMLDQF